MTSQISTEELEGLVRKLREIDAEDLRDEAKWNDAQGYEEDAAKLRVIICRIEQAADSLESLAADNARLREALEEIGQWAGAYPIDVFPEPDLEAVRAALGERSILYEMDRLHGSWARHLTSGIGDIARKALSGGSEG